VLIEIEVMHEIEEVRLDLLAGRKATRPMRIRSKRKGIEVGWHIARDPRIGVGAPHPPDAIAALQDHEVILPLLLERMSDSDATKPSPHDRGTSLAAHLANLLGCRIGVYLLLDAVSQSAFS